MSSQEVTLSMRQFERYETCRAVLDRRMTVRAAAGALRLSGRQVYRIKKRVERQGAKGVKHGNAGREPVNKTPVGVKEQAIRLAVTEYAQFNFSHLADMLGEEHGIVLSDETLRMWLRPMGHGRPVRRVKVHRRRRERRAREGEMLFLDGSPHPWFGQEEPESCLLLSSDDATGGPLWGKFQPEEDRDGCFEVAYHVFRKHGLPVCLYLDRASQFKTTRHRGTHYELECEHEDTHWQMAMKELAIELIFAHSPQARGRGERLNGSFQDRLVAELAYHGIRDCVSATRYLNRVFIPRYRRRFGKPPADPVPAWRPAPPVDLKAILCARYTRVVANDNTVSLDGTRYQLHPPQGRYHLVKARLEVQQRFDKTVHFFHERHGEIRGRTITKRNAPTNSKNPRVTQSLWY
jgi:transposase